MVKRRTWRLFYDSFPKKHEWVLGATCAENYTANKAFTASSVGVTTDKSMSARFACDPERCRPAPSVAKTSSSSETRCPYAFLATTGTVSVRNANLILFFCASLALPVCCRRPLCALLACSLARLSAVPAIDGVIAAARDQELLCDETCGARTARITTHDDVCARAESFRAARNFVLA